MQKTILLLFIPLFLLWACESSYFNAEKQIQEGIWSYDDPFSFTFNADDTVHYYDFILEITHDQTYPYQNIYFQVSTIFPDGDTITDPFSVNLANKFGEWNGQCWGDECTLKAPIQSKVKFKTIGQHKLHFNQYTRQDSLTGIQELEFSIVRTSK